MPKRNISLNISTYFYCIIRIATKVVNKKTKGIKWSGYAYPRKFPAVRGGKGVGKNA